MTRSTTNGSIFQRPAARYKQIKRFLNNNFDNIGYEMSLEGMSEINEKIQPQSNTYYFARRACRTHPDRKGNQVPDKNMSAFCDIPGFLSGRYINNDLKKSASAGNGFRMTDSSTRKVSGAAQRAVC